MAEPQVVEVDELDAALDTESKSFIGEDDEAPESKDTTEDPSEKSKIVPLPEGEKEAEQEASEGVEEVVETGEEGKLEEPTDEEELITENQALQTELQSMKRVVRQMQRQMTIMGKQVDRNVAEEIDEEGKVVEKELSEVEKIQQDLKYIGETRADAFELMVDVMKQMPDYKDVDDVVTRDRVDDLVEVVAKKMSDEKGIDPVEAAYSVEREIWSKSNPYKYLYGVIKEHHPDYAEVKAEVKEKKPAEVKKETQEAPGSVANVGSGGGDTKSGWTAKRIDAMPEDELDKVPNEVYEKYLRNELK